MAFSKGRSRQLFVLVVVLLVFSLILVFSLSKCGKDQEAGPGQNTDPEQNTESEQNTDPEQAASDQDYIMEIVDIDLLDPRGFAEDTLPVTECSLEAILYIADGPGKPKVEGEGNQTSQKDQWDGKRKNAFVMASAPLRGSLGLATSPIKPIQPIFPIPIDPPSPLVEVLNPEAGSQLVSGSTFTLKWTIDSGRELTVDILFSADGGKTYQEIATGIENNNAYKLKVPNVPSETCVFRVNAWVGTALLGYNHSPIFQVVPPSPPKPPPPQEPDPVREYPPPSYIEDNNAFISDLEDASRWFFIEHDLPRVARTVWQMSRIPFPCEADSNWAETPGLLAWSSLAGDVREFEVDFLSVLDRFKAEDGEPPPDHRGISFETAPGVILLGQTQRELYVRVLLLDDRDRIVGATRSEFQIVYGKPAVEQVAGGGNLIPHLQGIELQKKTTPGFGPGYYKPIPEKGIFIYAGGDRDWSFMMEQIPGESVEIDLQISTLPFSYRSISDFQNPAGLVYRSRASGLKYTTVRRFYSVSFAEFAPPFVQLGMNTITYYIRAVCYVPGEGPGTLIPVVSKVHKIHYTGNQQLYLLGQLDLDNLPPEEVVVKSYVPETDFWSYHPAQWPLHNHQEYFEVTRPIQAEEINFYIKNHETGDFLYPYASHMMKFPQTSRAEYQAVVDRMLPPGAWFRLTITQSNWSAIWNEFFNLLSQIYEGIQKHYNGLKHSLANLVADRFAFLGSDAQSYIRTAVRALIDYGLASVGLPPSLPNFEEMTDSSLRYCVWVALEEAAQSLGVPPDQVPHQVRNEIIDETKAQLKNLTAMKNVNPLNVGYLKPATKAMYRPAWVGVNIRNPHDIWSPSGTLTISYYPVGKPHFKIYKYVSLPIPSLAPRTSTFIRVYLKHDNTHLPVWNEYYWGDIGECSFNLTATYHVPDIETAAKEQGASGVSELHPDAYVFDMDPVYTFSTIHVPANYLSGP